VVLYLFQQANKTCNNNIKDGQLEGQMPIMLATYSRNEIIVLKRYAQLGHCCSSFLCCCSETLELSSTELSNCSIRQHI